MKIFIIGNIASGKSTVCKMLAKATGYKHHGIDNYRRRYNQDATVLGESMAWQFYIDAVSKKKEMIIENSGVSQNFELLRHKAGKPRMIILLHCPATECIRRHRQRMKKGYRLPPSPWKRPMENAITNIDALLRIAEYDIRIDSSEHSQEAVVEMIIELCGLKKLA